MLSRDTTDLRVECLYYIETLKYFNANKKTEFRYKVTLESVNTVISTKKHTLYLSFFYTGKIFGE